MKRIAVEIDGSGTVLSARALHDEENPGPVEYEYVPADDRLGAVRRIAELESEVALLRGTLNALHELRGEQ